MSWAWLGGAITERSGVIDLALEAKLLFGAFAAAAVAYKTDSPEAGIAAGVLAGMGVAALQIVLALHARANQVIIGIGLNLIALGGGPVFTGWLIDHLAQLNFNHLGQTDVLAAMFGAGGPTDFTNACPGGVPPKGAAADLAKACLSTSALSTRQGIIITLLFYAWASLHYFLAAIGLVKHMKASAT